MDVSLVASARRHDRVAHDYLLARSGGTVDEELDAKALFEFQVPNTLSSVDDPALHRFGAPGEVGQISPRSSLTSLPPPKPAADPPIVTLSPATLR